VTVLATPRRYRLTHRTEYSYDDVVLASYGRAHLIPRSGDGQQRVEFNVDIEPGTAEMSVHTDFFGNRSLFFAVHTPHRELTVTSRAVVGVHRTGVERDALRDLRARSVADRLGDRSDLDEDLLAARQFVLPSPMIPRSPEVTQFATDLLRPARSLDEVLVDLLERLGEFAYVSGATTVSTPLAEVLAGRQGVCQDFAHLGVAALRSIGLAARYVSGYLETRPPPGRPRLVGADASHAWISVFAPELGWVDLDPTNQQFVDDSYVVAAIGRDYADVPPLRGVIFTESTQSTMDVSVDLEPIDESMDTAVGG
jgi:transglutaminase-like putative cysteine protease